MSEAPGRLDAARAVVGFAFAESLRRRVFAVVLVLTVIFLALYALGAYFAFREVESLGLAAGALVDERELTGSTVFGLAMFAILFLGAVLATFLTIGVARYCGAAAATIAYVLGVYTVALLATWLLGDYTPDSVLAPGLALAAAAAIVAAISMLASVFMTATAQGIAVFMIFGAGLVGGLLGQIGNALDSPSLERIAEAVTWALPFEALYQQALYLLSSETLGITGALVQLGPFGGAQQAGAGLWLWAILYTAAVIGAAVYGFARRDL
jgi:hypothetical protein